jgi:4-hydroxybenzoate polyprenyltransferase
MPQYIILLRPKHWIKNLFLFAAPFFGGKILSGEMLFMAFPAFISFSFCASAAYIFNDIKDLKEDRLHPEKKNRPLASGRVSIGSASMFALALVIPSFLLSYRISPLFSLYILLYLLIHVGYSLYLKHIAVIDIFCIASGFIIRVLAGGAVFNVEVSQWLLLSMFMISLVLASGKRLGEIRLLNEEADKHRKSLTQYSTDTLSEILLISAASSLIAYALYTVEQFRSLVYTVPVVIFGLFRYLMLTKKGIGDPTDAITKDKFLAASIIIWLLLIAMIRYL